MPVLSASSSSSSASSMMPMEHCHTLAFFSLSLGSVVLLVASAYLRRKAHSFSSSSPVPASQTEYPSEKEPLSRNWDEKVGGKTRTSPPQPPPYPYASQPQASGSATFPIEPPQHQGSNYSYYSQSPSLPLPSPSPSPLPPNSFFATDANPIFYTAEPEEYLPSPQQLWSQLQILSHPASYPGAGRTESSISSKSWFDDNPQTYYSTPVSTPGSSYTSPIPPAEPGIKNGSYSSMRSISSLDSDGLPRRRSYTKTRDSGEKMSGEILIGEGGWRRHTRVFGGGSCRACEESEEKARRMGIQLPSPIVPLEVGSS